jgi:hypothetical protein
MNGALLAAKSRRDESPYATRGAYIGVRVRVNVRCDRNGVVVLIDMNDADSSSLADELMKIVPAAPAPDLKK